MLFRSIQKLKEAYKNYEFTAASDHGIGLLNVLQRCSIYYEERFDWEIQSIPKVETTVEFVIVKENKEQE